VAREPLFSEPLYKHAENTCKSAISSGAASTNTYVNNKKLVIAVKYTNDAYWDVLNYDFIEGKPYTKQQIDGGDHVAVISESLKKDYFGDDLLLLENILKQTMCNIMWQAL